MSRLSPTCLDPSSVPGPIFTFHGLELSRPSLTSLGLGSKLGPTFTSYGLGHIVRAQHSPENFSKTHMGPSVFYIDLIHIILIRIQLKISQ